MQRIQLASHHLLSNSPLRKIRPEIVSGAAYGGMGETCRCLRPCARRPHDSQCAISIVQFGYMNPCVLQGKLFGFRGGRPFFDIGWRGYIQANVDICAGGKAHTISFRYDGAHYHIWIDGKEVADVYRSERISAGNAKAKDDQQVKIVLAQDLVAAADTTSITNQRTRRSLLVAELDKSTTKRDEPMTMNCSRKILRSVLV